ncbi:TolC family protein [Pseudomonas cichorii]|uniref:TolC family protein n=1 Tax=Pseudomonas lijiangensis TaxID=2995658 RepID=A0ABX8HM94_9PSED|nr:TolC family protein [Pseudomonas cichorii]MBX8499690.1 TolC family protein [Pseudomonas lijiangensis]MBX8505190.1 TolC family protein [Pseudomonas lijiangensis]MBX8508277.1 TolC family protein [Pseudomonas cichorii]MBX8523384.1 TolC family protein [Pseudomonas cichorii]
MIDLCRSLLVCCLVLGGLESAVAAPLVPGGPSMPGRAVSLSEQTIELTLADAVFLGLRDNRSIRSAYLDRIAQKFDLRVAQDLFTPKLVLSSRYLATRNQSDHYRQAEVIPQTTMLGEYGTQLSLAWSNQLTMADTAGRTRNDGATLTVIQPLLRGAGKEVATAPVRLAVLSEKVNRLALKSTVSDTINRIITGYRELLRAQEQVRIARDALERSRQLLDANRAMISAGQMAEFDIVQTEADVATQELAIEEAANQLDASRLELLRLLALDLGTRLRAVEVLDARRIEVSAQQALLTARERQPAYLTRLIAGKQAEINLLVARNERLWDVSLIGGATQVRDRSQNDFGPSTNRTWEGYAGVQIDIPIGDLSRRQAEVRARVDVENQELLLAEANQSLAQDVGDGVRDLGTRWRQYEISQRARELSLRKLNIEREKLQSGRSSNFQVLSFEADLRNAENARLNALIAYLNAQTSLDQTLGTTLESWDIDLND